MIQRTTRPIIIGVHIIYLFISARSYHAGRLKFRYFTYHRTSQLVSASLLSNPASENNKIGGSSYEGCSCPASISQALSVDAGALSLYLEVYVSICMMVVQAAVAAIFVRRGFGLQHNVHTDGTFSQFISMLIPVSH